MEINLVFRISPGAVFQTTSSFFSEPNNATPLHQKKVSIFVAQIYFSIADSFWIFFLFISFDKNDDYIDKKGINCTPQGVQYL